MIYRVRHCSTTGQEPGAPLTGEGQAQARDLAQMLSTFGITRIVSSPYRRAVQSIEPFALASELGIETDERLRERVLSTAPLPDWKSSLRQAFDDEDFAARGGETSRVAADRALATLHGCVSTQQATVVVSHGNLTSLLLRRIGWPMTFEASLSLTNPDVFRIRKDDDRFDITRLWN